MTDEEIYAKVKPIGKRGRHRSNGVSPYITSLYETFSEGEKLRKEADEAKNEAIEAKKEAKEANVKNKALTKKMGGLQKEMEVMKVKETWCRWLLECLKKDLGDVAEGGGWTFMSDRQKW
uniref:Uncharacterized protein n=1 Tax=Chenopodium quinoa TaxID=63459 RepID=A0A803N9X9_CHEQI